MKGAFFTAFIAVHLAVLVPQTNAAHVALSLQQFKSDATSRMVHTGSARNSSLANVFSFIYESLTRLTKSLKDSIVSFFDRLFIGAADVLAPKDDYVIRSACLSADEYIDYPLDPKLNPDLGSPASSTFYVSIRDRETGMEKYQFKILDAILGHYHPIELHSCGVYLIKEPNPSSAVAELWKYDYTGKSKEILPFSARNKDNTETIVDYAFDFRIDSTEKYLTLIEGYQGTSTYNLVIKDLNNLQGVFVLPYQEIVRRIESYDSFQKYGGGFELYNWTEDGKYFWGRIQSGAQTTAYFRIERDTWKLEAFEVPDGTQGGDPINIERGYVTYNNGPGWIGLDVIAEQVYEQWRKEGRVVSFYLYNLFTKQSILLATSSDSAYSGGIRRWISDTELEYMLPSGEKRIYTISQ